MYCTWLPISAPRRRGGWQDESHGTGPHSLAKGFSASRCPVGSVLRPALEVSWGGRMLCATPE